MLNYISSIEVSYWQILWLFVLVWLVWFNLALANIYPEIGPIKHHIYKKHNTKVGYGTKNKDSPDRIYIIAGGSGFVGSWIARYLLARGDRVVLYDNVRPPSDLLKHGAHWAEVDLTFSAGLINEIRRTLDSVYDDTQVVIYNCALRKRYDLHNFRADLGMTSVETLYIALNNFPQKRIFIIDIGDCLSHRQPIKNSDRFVPTPELWCQTTAVGNNSTAQSLGFVDSNEPDSRMGAFSSYAWHQLQVERMTRRTPDIFSTAVAGSAVLLIDGFPSGHVGDGFLSPLVYQNRAVLHSEKVPFSLINVEDVARAALALEYLLLDPETRATVSSQSFVVGSPETTNLKQVFDYVKTRRSKMRVYRLPPALVYAATFLFSFVYTGKPKAHRTWWDSVLRLTPQTLTFARFYTCQVGQVPNPANEKLQKELLAFNNNYTLHETLSSLLDDIEEVERIDAAKKQGRKTQ